MDEDTKCIRPEMPLSKVTMCMLWPVSDYLAAILYTASIFNNINMTCKLLVQSHKWSILIYGEVTWEKWGLYAILVAGDICTFSYPKCTELYA